MTTLKKIGKRFSLESHVKAVLFGHFFRDAADWIALYHHSQSFPVHNMSIMTKQFIMLRMALECILKAILIGLSKKDETAKEAYIVARKCSHNLSKIIAECKERANGKYRICTKQTFERIQKIDKLGIGVRYDLDMKTAYKKESFTERITGTGPVSGVIIDEEFQEDMKNDFLHFVRLAKRVWDKRLKGYNIILGSRIKEINDYINSIISSAKRRN
ncbi:hypothetical protein [Thermosulfurimonas dismutans]|uniref:Uncharacterized protein n=1 Tax=Thermosulfurimonas dismutans TaxID=999894 RepID=A0A179D1U7_9BACT|nr:hypothetical protein [Thermosulfurimonas dismutans]OAQ20037.1 hypothetical protein TDIS_1856 [Thermosulfurimonas dismutans]